MILPLFGGVYLTVFAANLLIFISGTTLTWSSSEIPKLMIAGNLSRSPFDAPISPEQASWISSLITLGAAAGPFVFGWLADKIGRKPTLLYLGVPLLFSYVMLAFGTNVEVFYVARFIAGIALGGTFTVLPIYIGEVSPPARRGALSSSMGCFCCLGLFFSVTLGPFIPVRTFNLILAALPVAYLVGFCVVAPESPAYLVGAGEEGSARETLERLGRPKEELEREMGELTAAQKEDDGSKGCFDIFRSKGTIKAFLISLGLLVFQQFSGINAVLFYSQQIFKETGSRLSPKYCAIVVVGVQFLSSFVTPLIADKYGRRHILLLSAVGMVVSEVPLGAYCYLKLHGVDVDAVSFVPLFALTTFILFFNVGFGPLPWLIICEVFPTSLRSAATALVSTLIWLLSFAVTKYFERAVKAFGLGEMFLFFAACCVSAVVFTSSYVVETKGKSYPEIQAELSR